METIADAPIWVQYLLLLPLGCALLVAAVTDFRERKVYNWLTYPMVVVGLLLHTIAFGLSGFLIGFLTALAVLVVGLLILPFRWFGGGDIKLLIAIGATLGPTALFEIFFYALLVGCGMGFGLALFGGYFRSLFRRLGRFIRSLAMSAVTMTNMTEDLETDQRSYLPFAIPIFIGAALATSDALLQWPLLLETIRGTMAALIPR